MSEFKKPTHVVVDVEAALRLLFPTGMVLTKDLMEGEVVCKECHGLGARRWDSSYGLKGDDPNLGSFPYTQQAVSACGACFDGTQTLCTHCKKPFPKSRKRCECDAAFNERAQRDEAKEAERREQLPRISLEEYTFDTVFDPDSSEYITADNFADLEPNSTYFACVPSCDWLRIDVDAILERMSEMADQECTEGAEMFDLLDGAKEALQEAVDVWMGKYVKLRTAYFPDENLIVVAPEQSEET